MSVVTLFKTGKRKETHLCIGMRYQIQAALNISISRISCKERSGNYPASSALYWQIGWSEKSLHHNMVNALKSYCWRTRLLNPFWALLTPKNHTAGSWFFFELPLGFYILETFMVPHTDSIGRSRKPCYVTGRNPSAQQLGAGWQHHMLFLPALNAPTCALPWSPPALEVGMENWKAASTTCGAELCDPLLRGYHLRICPYLLCLAGYWQWKPPPHETALASVFISYFNLSEIEPNIWFLCAMLTMPSSVQMCKTQLTGWNCKQDVSRLSLYNLLTAGDNSA